MEVEAEPFDSHESEGLFNLTRIKDKVSLSSFLGEKKLWKGKDKQLVETVEPPSSPDESEDEGEDLVDQEIKEDEEKIQLNPLKEGYVYDTVLERYLDTMYNEWTEVKKKRQAASDPFRDVPLFGAPTKVAQDEPLAEDLSADEGEGVDYEEEERIKKRDKNPLIIEEEIPLNKKTDLWFNDKLFEGVETETDELKEIERLALERFNKKLPVDDKVYVPSAPSSSGKKQFTKSEAAEEVEADPKKNAKFEVVPKEPELDSDEEDWAKMSLKERAEALALGQMLLRKKSKNELIESMGYTKWTAAEKDEDLPRWFREEDKKFFRPYVPISATAVSEIEARLKELNARSIKKIAEAKARKKKRSVLRLEKVRSQAESVMKDGNMGDVDKLRTIEKLYGRAKKKEKRKTVYVVSRNFKGGDGMAKKKGVRIKLVDPRMKSDKRGAEHKLKNPRPKKKRKTSK